MITFQGVRGHRDPKLQPPMTHAAAAAAAAALRSPPRQQRRLAHIHRACSRLSMRMYDPAAHLPEPATQMSPNKEW